MIDSLIERLQINEYDFFVFCIDLVYILLTIIIAARFSHYFSSFKLDAILSHETHYIIVGSFIFSVAIVAASIASHAMHESFFNGFLSIAIYTIMTIFIALSRLSIGLINIEPNKLREYNTQGNKASYLYESASLITSAIIISSVLHYFYELNVMHLFIICIAAEFFVEVMIKIYLVVFKRYSKIKLLKDIQNQDISVIGFVCIYKLHLSLALFAAASVVSPSSYSIVVVLATWFAFASLIAAIVAVITLIIDKILLDENFKICRITKSKEESLYLMHGLIYLAMDVSVIALFI